MRVDRGVGWGDRTGKRHRKKGKRRIIYVCKSLLRNRTSASFQNSSSGMGDSAEVGANHYAFRSLQQAQHCGPRTPDPSSEPQGPPGAKSYPKTKILKELITSPCSYLLFLVALCLLLPIAEQQFLRHIPEDALSPNPLTVPGPITTNVHDTTLYSQQWEGAKNQNPTINLPEGLFEKVLFCSAKEKGKLKIVEFLSLLNSILVELLNSIQATISWPPLYCS